MPRYRRSYMDPSGYGDSWYNPMSERTDPWWILRNTLQDVMRVRKESEQEEYVKRQQELQNKLAEREMALKERESEARIKDWLKTEPKELSEWQFRVKVAEDMGDRFPGGRAGLELFKATGKLPEEPKPEKPPAPDVYDKKKVDLAAMLKRGEITQEQFAAGMNELTGIPAPKAPDVPSTSERRSIETDVIKWASGIGADDPKKNKGRTATGFTDEYLKKNTPADSGPRLSGDTAGYVMVMPVKYNVSKKRIEYGIGDKADEEAVKNHEDMFQVFVDGILPQYPTFDAFLRSGSQVLKDKRLDINLVKQWYAIWERKEDRKKFLGIL